MQYADKIDTKKAVEVLESFGTNEGMLFYLANVLPKTDDPEIYFKYIQGESTWVHGDIDLNWTAVARLIELSYRCNLCRRCAQTCSVRWSARSPLQAGRRRR